MIDSVASLGGLTASTPGRDPAKIRQAAEQFEALMIGQLLKTAREAGGAGWLGTGDDEAGAIGCEMAEQELARSLAASGGFGMARLIAQGLETASGRTTTTPHPESAPGPADTAGESGG